MVYITSEQYASYYPDDAIPAADFGRYARQASRLMDNQTTGVDGVAKLTAHPPTGDNAEQVIFCAAVLVHTISKVEEQETAAGLVKQADGTYQGGTVASRSAGNESISYATGNKSGSAIATAAGDVDARATLYSQIVAENLRGVKDCNGVNLLYLGVYPSV